MVLIRRSRMFISIRKQLLKVKQVSMCVKMYSEQCQVWVKFQRTTANGKTLKLRIQDVPNDRKQDAMDMFHRYFMSEEPVIKSYRKKFPFDDAVKKEEINKWNEFLSSSALMSICCFDEDQSVGELLGLSIAYIIKRNEYDLESQKYDTDSESARNMLRLSKEIHGKYNPFKTFHDVNVYLDDIGVVVHPKYRGLGICGEFLKARRLQSKALGADMTGGWLTTAASQRAAAKDGWTEVMQISYEDLAKEYQLTFDNVPPTIKIAVATDSNLKCST